MPRVPRGCARHSPVYLVMIVGFTLAGCGKHSTGGPPGGMVVQVVGFRAVEQPVEDRVAVVGTLTADEWVAIKSEIDGIIKAIGFEEGQRVKANEVLFRIDRSKLESSLAEAEANLKLAEATYQRYAALAQSRAVSQQEIDQARMTYEARRAALELMRQQLGDTDIIAPFPGTVGARLISLGQYVTKGQTLTSLIDDDTLKVEFHVPERFMSQLTTAKDVEVQVASYPNERFRGTVYFVDPQVDPTTRTVLVKARLANPDGKLRSGMFANLDVILQVHERAVVIPETALMLEGQTTSVFVVNAENLVEPRNVTTGVRLPDGVEIVTGLRPEETVITEGGQKVHPGAKVSVRYEDPPQHVTPQAPLL